MTMTLVETVTVGSGGASSIEFTSIPQDADDLLLVFSGRAANFAPLIRINNNSSAVYTYRYLRGTGSSVTSSTDGTTDGIYNQRITTITSATANTFGNGSLYFANYTSSANKSISIDGVSENNATEAFQTISAVSVADTNPITSILISQSLVEHSTASLYKITKA